MNNACLQIDTNMHARKKKIQTILLPLGLFSFNLWSTQNVIESRDEWRNENIDCVQQYLRRRCLFFKSIIRGIMVFRFPYCYYVYKQPFKLNIKTGSISMVW